jgi:hypothetical protein
MPLIRTKSSRKLANQEGKILLALSDLKDSRIKSIRAVAKLYNLPLLILYYRASRRISRVNKRSSSHKLT